MRITLEDIFGIPTAVIYYPDLYKSVTSVSIDTRTIKKNSLFVAIKGKNFDGHNYINEAVKKGAKAIVVNSRKLKSLDDIEIPIISVRNTTKAYGELARIWRNKLSAKVISITGSNGKTTTKEILFELLSSKYKVHKTLANNNNQIGVPLTIFSTPRNTDFIILEHGTNHFGEIDYTAKIANPDYALITNIGTSHIKYLESKNKILKEKEELFKNIKNNGTVFLNIDDNLLRRRSNKYGNRVTFGFDKVADVHAEITNVLEDGKYKLNIKGFGKSIDVSLPILGKANSSNYLAAVSVALKLGITKKDILKTTNLLKSVKGRLNDSEFNDFTIIDDTYNANPESVKNAIDVVEKITSRKNKVIILGDMFELGEDSVKIHKRLAKEFSGLVNTSVLTIGKSTKEINKALNKKIKFKKHFSNRASLKKYLREINISDSVFLLKGSRGMRMEEFVETLMGRAA